MHGGAGASAPAPAVHLTVPTPTPSIERRGAPCHTVIGYRPYSSAASTMAMAFEQGVGRELAPGGEEEAATRGQRLDLLLAGFLDVLLGVPMNTTWEGGTMPTIITLSPQVFLSSCVGGALVGQVGDAHALGLHGLDLHVEVGVVAAVVDEDGERRRRGCSWRSAGA